MQEALQRLSEGLREIEQANWEAMEVERDDEEDEREAQQEMQEALERVRQGLREIDQAEREDEEAERDASQETREVPRGVQVLPSGLENFGEVASRLGGAGREAGGGDG